MSRAWDGDPVSSFGSIVCMAQKPDLACAWIFLKGRFVELIIAPGYDEEELAFLKNKSKDFVSLNYPWMTGNRLRIHTVMWWAECLSSREQGIVWKNGRLWRSILSLMKRKSLLNSRWRLPNIQNQMLWSLPWEYEKGVTRSCNGCGTAKQGGFNSKTCSYKKPGRTSRFIYRENRIWTKKNLLRTLWASGVLSSDAFFPFDDSIIHSDRDHIRYIVFREAR